MQPAIRFRAVGSVINQGGNHVQKSSKIDQKHVKCDQKRTKCDQIWYHFPLDEVVKSDRFDNPACSRQERVMNHYAGQTYMQASNYGMLGLVERGYFCCIFCGQTLAPCFSTLAPFVLHFEALIHH